MGNFYFREFGRGWYPAGGDAHRLRLLQTATCKLLLCKAEQKAPMSKGAFVVIPRQEEMLKRKRMLRTSRFWEVEVPTWSDGKFRANFRVRDCAIFWCVTFFFMPIAFRCQDKRSNIWPPTGWSLTQRLSRLLCPCKNAWLSK